MSVAINVFGAHVSVQLEGVRGCCGVKSLYNFSAWGDEDLTPEQVDDLYDALLLEVVKTTSRGLLVATDVVPEYTTDVDHAWFDDTCTRGEKLSLVGFCRHHGWKESDVGFNTNTGNSVVSFSFATRIPTLKADEIDWDEHCDDWGDRCYDELYTKAPLPTPPEFPKPEPKPAIAGDASAEQVLAAVREYLASLEAA